MMLTIFGEPKGQPRPRAFARRMGARYVARVYESDVADAWKANVRSVLTAQNIRQHFSKRSDAGAFKVSLTFGFKRPKSHFTSKGVLRSGVLFDYVQKPDVDNLAKLVLDELTKTQLIWRDDSQVIELTVVKCWSPMDWDEGFCIVDVALREQIGVASGQ
jgi:Holliday junction resolvase RusA-like endonuclease